MFFFKTLNYYNNFKKKNIYIKLVLFFSFSPSHNNICFNKYHIFMGSEQEQDSSTNSQKNKASNLFQTMGIKGEICLKQRFRKRMKKKCFCYSKKIEKNWHAKNPLRSRKQKGSRFVQSTFFSFFFFFFCRSPFFFSLLIYA